MTLSLAKYVEDEKKFSDNQNAFRKVRCTSDIKNILNKYLNLFKKMFFVALLTSPKPLIGLQSVWRKGL